MVKELDKIIEPVAPQPENQDMDTIRLVHDDREVEWQHKKKQAELDAELEERRKRRNFSEEGCFYWVRVTAVYLTAVIALAVLAIYWWHILGPECCRWLPSYDLERIERMGATIIVGIVGTLSVSFFLKKR